MNSSPKFEIASHVDDPAMLAPWAATGRLNERDARQFAATMASDPTLAEDVAAARAERDAVVALASSLGRPSARALAGLFEAIDAAECGGNVRTLRFGRRLTPVPPQAMKKIGSLR